MVCGYRLGQDRHRLRKAPDMPSLPGAGSIWQPQEGHAGVSSERLTKAPRATSASPAAECADQTLGEEEADSVANH